MSNEKGTSFFDKIEAFLNKFSTIKLFLLLYISKVFIYIIILLILFILGANIELSGLSITPKLIYEKVIFPSLIETLLFQFLIIELLTKTKLKKHWIILISGLSFALAHYQNLIYILYEIPFGFFYAITYLIFRKRSSGKFLMPLVMVFLIHLLWNLTVLLT